VPSRRLREWWPLAALLLLAAALRLPTIGAQSFWYDEAFTPVHVLHASLGATLRAVSHTENSPPLWYLLEWGFSRALGTGEVALRLLSALAGVATVAVAWGVGRELAGRRAALATALLVAVNPLFVWYSQEARVYALFVLAVALALWCFLRALRDPTPRRLGAFAAGGALALATHYFAVFLLAPMCVWLLASTLSRPARVSPVRDPDAGPAGRTLLSSRPRAAQSTVAAVAAVALVGLALVPLIVAQGGHGTQWIGRWALSNRLQAIPQYYLTSYYGSALGHGVELLVSLPILAGILFGLWHGLTREEEHGALLALVIAACGVLIPIALVVLGADYLAPRNLVAAMIPLTALLAVVVVARRTGWIGVALAGVIALGFLAIVIDVNLSPRLQRGDWRGLAAAIRTAPGSVQPRVLTTVELGAAPLEYYLPPLHNLTRGATVTVSEIDETGYAPLRAGAREPPAPGFHLVEHRDIHGLILYRFLSPIPRAVSEATLRRHVITLEHPEVLVR
jgi:mannosyltransferase